MKIHKHWLVAETTTEKVRIDKTDNSRNEIDPDYLIVHYTSADTADSSISWFKDTTTNNSAIAAHIVIDTDGTITQLVAFNCRANHAGSSTWNGVDNMNHHSIGIELVNPGNVEKLADNTYRREIDRDKNKKPIYKTYPASIASKLVKVNHKKKYSGGANAVYWFKYPQAQLSALYQVSTLLMSSYHLIQAIGHDDISPVRKTDPGPAFNWVDFRQQTMGAATNVGKIFIVNGGDGFANLRSEPTTNSLAKKLNNGYEVGLIETVGNWSKVYLANTKTDMMEGDRCIKKMGWIHNTLLVPKP